jgi:hypothetical protein
MAFVVNYVEKGIREQLCVVTTRATHVNGRIFESQIRVLSMEWTCEKSVSYVRSF